MINFIDFEASGLDLRNSYPIEVGWCDLDGNGDSFLIKPDSEWWHWDPKAADIHKITYEMINQHGTEPVMVASILNKKFDGTVVYCDGRQYDQFWMGRLYEAAQMAPTFALGDYSENIRLCIVNRPCSANEKQKKWNNFMGEYRSPEAHVQHRALPDCQRLARLFRTHA